MKRNFRRAKRTYKRRRTFRKRIAKRPRYNRPDVGYSEKVTYRGDYMCDTTIPAPGFYFTAHWMGNGTSSNQDVYPLDQPQFLQMTRVFRQYKITGMAVKITPYSQLQNTGSVAYPPVNSGTIMDLNINTQLPLVDMQQALDYKQFSFNRPIHRYYHVSKYSKASAPFQWLDTQALPSANVKPDCCTGFYMPNSGWANGDVSGTVEITWYVKFKTRKN